MEPARRRYEPRGEAIRLLNSHEPEVILSGPAGTGKSRVCLEKLHLCCALIPGLRCLIVRKTLTSLKASGLVTFDEKVKPHLDGVRYATSTKRPPQYVYPNGSVLVVGGMDDPAKVLSTEYDLIYVQQAEELDEEDWDNLSSRCRNYKLPWQQLLADCNPDVPQHWLKLRADAGKSTLYESRHEDNPLLYDASRGAWTEQGKLYLARLQNLAGVRYDRLYLGLWAAAVGMIYAGSWDARRNLIYRQEVCQAQEGANLSLYGDCGIDRTWPRYMSIDYGLTNPFVCQFWAQDADGRLYRYREIYMSGKLISEHAETIKRYARWKEPGGDPLPYLIVGDPSGGEAKKHLGQLLGQTIIDAPNDVATGINLVSSRLKAAMDGKPRLFLLRDSLVERDPALEEAKKPCCTEEELPGYIWADTAKERPKKVNDHGADDMRYMIASLDLQSAGTVWWTSGITR